MALFNRFNLETPESVELEFNLAGIGNRAYALCLDYLFLGLTLIVVLIVWSLLIVYAAYADFWSFEQLELWLFAIQLLIIFFIYTGYFVVFETLWQGQTPGKRWVKIRVIKDDGTPVSVTHSLLRALLRPIDDIFFLGAFLIVFSKREKRLGDLLAGTLVVREEQSRLRDKMRLSVQAQNLAPTLNVSGLLPEEFATIREYLERREQFTPEARTNLGDKLANRVITLLELEEVPKGTTPELLLEAVYLAYQNQFYRT